MTNQPVSCGIKSMVSLRPEKVCFGHPSDWQGLLQIEMAIEHVVLRVTRKMKRGNERNCFVKQSKRSRCLYLSVRGCLLVPSSLMSWGTRDTSLNRRQECWREPWCPGLSKGRWKPALLPTRQDLSRHHPGGKKVAKSLWELQDVFVIYTKM